MDLQKYCWITRLAFVFVVVTVRNLVYHRNEKETVNRSHTPVLIHLLFWWWSDCLGHRDE